MNFMQFKEYMSKCCDRGMNRKKKGTFWHLPAGAAGRYSTGRGRGPSTSPQGGAGQPPGIRKEAKGEPWDIGSLKSFTGQKAPKLFWSLLLPSSLSLLARNRKGAKGGDSTNTHFGDLLSSLKWIGISTLIPHSLTPPRLTGTWLN